jgi:hypothetical protein
MQKRDRLFYIIFHQLGAKQTHTETSSPFFAQFSFNSGELIDFFREFFINWGPNRLAEI